MIGVLAAWLNHFQNGFHYDDFQNIVNNQAVHGLSAVPRFFQTPRTFSDQPEYSQYRPLLSTSFAVDYAVAGSNAAVFQMDSFVWFAALLFLLYGLFRLIPGGSHQSAAFGAGLFGLHPVAADTVNYIARRGAIFELLGITCGLLVWIVWPRMFPEALPLNVERTPNNWQEETILAQAARLNRIYRAILYAPIGLYLFPVVLAMLADASTAVFAPILLAYLVLLDPDRGPKRVLPSAIVCGAYWIFQSLLVWRFGGHAWIAPLHWWATQPWLVLRHFFAFLAPFNLNADGPMNALEHVWSPLALAGYAGLAALIYLAIFTARREPWKAVSFGLWWFLLALLPGALVPQATVPADTQMFAALGGLVFATTRTISVLWSRISEPVRTGIPAIAAAGLLYAALMTALGVMTYERNAVWESETTLWRDVVAKDPGNGRALVRSAYATLAEGDTALAHNYLTRAIPLISSDSALETDTAIALDKLSLDAEAETHFKRAIAAGPDYARAYSYYAAWLATHLRSEEAFKMATRAVQLEPDDLVAHRTLMDLYSQRFDWADLRKEADQALKVEPADATAQRSKILAQATIDTITKTEDHVKGAPTVDEYLNLSVLYYKNGRFEDCVNACRHALKLRPDAAEAYANMATAQHALGKDDDAIAALREVVRLRPDMKFAQSDLRYLIDHKNQPVK